MALREYPPGTPFPGTIGRTVDRSSPAWPRPIRAKPGAPSVVFIVLDDTGFGQLGCYGSPIRTPNLDRLAAGGLLYNGFHTTALCSPTRSCLLTGRNHHSNAMAGITEISTGYPSYNGNIPFENGFLSEMLVPHGYNTYAVGKWHLTPAEQTSAAGPYDRWPLGRGFERFYGFLGGDTHQYYPELVSDNHATTPPRTPEQGYHLTADLVDKATQFIADSKQVAPDKPFFLYFCTGAMHAPHHVPRELADRYVGQFDDGWEAYREKVLARQKELGVVPPGTRLSRQDPDVQAWETLSVQERRLYARMMEVYAGFLEHTDHHIGRLLAFLEDLDALDNTLVMAFSDNGASAEGGLHGSVNENRFFNNVPESLEENLKAIDELGGPRYYNHYPWGWAWAGDTPLRRWKRETYRGGTADACIVHWPRGMKARGEVRTQYAHAIDVVPTVLDALGLEPPTQVRGVTQSPIEGVSFVHTFDDAKAESRHRVQYFEMFGHRAIYEDGWRAVCPVPGPSFAEAGIGFGQLEITEETLRELDAHGWELYHVAEDFSETQDLARTHQDKLIELICQWYVEAGRYDVLPLDSRGAARLAEERPQLTVDRRHFVYYPHTAPIGESTGPKLLNRPHDIRATVTLQDGAEGVLVADGGVTGGFCLFVQDRRLHYVYNYAGAGLYHLESDARLPSGRTELRFHFQPTAAPEVAHGLGTPGLGQLFIGEQLVAEGELPRTLPLLFGMGGGLSVGRDATSPVCDMYPAPYAFTGELEKVVVDVGGAPQEDLEARTRQAMVRQ
jgi:arylsulfatase A-like enzyme